MQRVMQVIELGDVKEMYNQGYSHKEIAEYVYTMTMQTALNMVKKLAKNIKQ